MSDFPSLGLCDRFAKVYWKFESIESIDSIESIESISSIESITIFQSL